MSCLKLCFETELDRALRAHSESGGFGGESPAWRYSSAAHPVARMRFPVKLFHETIER
jgi:hypothetical protein